MPVNKSKQERGVSQSPAHCSLSFSYYEVTIERDHQLTLSVNVVKLFFLFVQSAVFRGQTL
jgi:hypothetical protein